MSNYIHIITYIFCVLICLLTARNSFKNAKSDDERDGAHFLGFLGFVPILNNILCAVIFIYYFVICVCYFIQSGKK